MPIQKINKKGMINITKVSNFRVTMLTINEVLSLPQVNIETVL